MIFEHLYNLSMSCLPSRDFDTIGCLSHNVNHLFKLRVFECLNGLDIEISTIVKFYGQSRHTWSVATSHSIVAFLKNLSEYGTTHPASLRLGFRTGTVIPAVFPKRVTQVRVRYWILAHRVPVPRCHGYSRVNYIIIVSIFLITLISIFLNHFIFSKVKRSEFETPTNATNSRVCLHPPPTWSTANARPLGHHFWVSGRGWGQGKRVGWD
jgi:hypothetical protein